ncbi:MAG TPA: PEGA domain-containing protein [Kofleriaceae bacterium]|nr:PEGA domain-containing protein [Kofleriaceae bacterium]
MIPRRHSGLCALLALALLSLAAAPARADDGDETVGVLVTGEATMQPQLVAQLETWLRTHGHEIVSTPLSPEAINALIDCIVIEDPLCARQVVEKRATAGTLVFAQVNLDRNVQDRNVTLTLYWLGKGKDVLSEQHVCARCTDNLIRSAADNLMKKITGDDVPRGRVRLRSKPPNAQVSIDGKERGRAPATLRLPAGAHTAVFEFGTRPAQTRSFKVEAGQVQTVSVTFAEPPMPFRKKLGIAAIASGVLLGAGGGVLIAIDEDNVATPTADEFHTETLLPGVALAASGAVAIGVGVYLLVSTPSERSVPTVGLAPGGGVVGWAGRF